jgi:hypothetical protein
MKSVSDGVAVWVDKRRKELSVSDMYRAKDFLHCDDDAPAPETPQLDGDTFFVTVQHTMDLAKGMMTRKKSSITNIPMMTNSQHFSHMVLTGEITYNDDSGQEDCLHVNVEFAPKSSARKAVVRNYVLSIRTHASYMIEMHDDNDTDYVHGMRKVVAHIGTELCSVPVVNYTLGTPLPVMKMSVEECLGVIRCMKLERSMKEDEDEDEKDKDVLVEQMGIIGCMDEERTEGVSSKTSIYPVGMMFMRQVNMIPASLKIIAIIKVLSFK